MPTWGGIGRQLTSLDPIDDGGLRDVAVPGCLSGGQIFGLGYLSAPEMIIAAMDRGRGVRTVEPFAQPAISNWEILGI